METPGMLASRREPRHSVEIECMYLSLLLVLTTCFALPALSQSINERYWKRYRSMADSVVISRLGKGVFKRYVYTEEQVHHDLSDFIYLYGDTAVAWSDRHHVTTPPQYCYFEYEVCLDRKEGGPTIRFALDPQGRFVPNEPSNGLIQPPLEHTGSEMDIHTFERIARARGVQWDLEDRYRMLAWVADEDVDAVPATGTYELTLGRLTGQCSEDAPGGSTYLFDSIEGICFDAYTGEVLKEGILQVPSGIVCRGGSL